MMKLSSLRSLWRRLKRHIAYRRLTGSDFARYLGVKVGANCRILSKSFGSEPFLISIGDDVTISSDVRFITHDGATWLIRDAKGRRFSYGSISIGNHVFVGAGTTIMPGVSIGDNVVIGAASVVTKSVPSGVVVAGNPARVLKSFADFANSHLQFSASSQDLAHLSDYRARAEAALSQRQRPIMSSPFAMVDTEAGEISGKAGSDEG